jgi:6-phosphogluconolactonase/glucosamine-6-phosphate isomerase/deaminase
VGVFLPAGMGRLVSLGMGTTGHIAPL